jgi:hypothetical protein
VSSDDCLGGSIIVSWVLISTACASVRPTACRPAIIAGPLASRFQTIRPRCPRLIMKRPTRSVIGLVPEQHGPQRENGRADPDDRGGLSFRDGGRLFHHAITARRSGGSRPQLRTSAGYSRRDGLARELFRRVKLAVEPAKCFGRYRIALNLRLVNMTAFGASKGPMLEARTRRDNALNRRTGLAPRTARTLHSTGR